MEDLLDPPKVTDGNWAPCSPWQNQKVSEDVWPLDARHVKSIHIP